MVRIDVAFCFERLGGPKGVFQALRKAFPKTPLQYATVQMWQQRQAISQQWQAPILYLMKENCRLDPLTCMVSDDDPVFQDLP